jgi:NIPSNAP
VVYEERVYEVAPGRMPDLHERFRKHTLRLFERHGITPVAFFVAEIGGASNELRYILSFSDLAARESAWRAFLADDEWQSVKQESEVPGPLVTRIRNAVLTPVDYSPLK